MKICVSSQSWPKLTINGTLPRCNPTLETVTFDNLIKQNISIIIKWLGFKTWFKGGQLLEGNCGGGCWWGWLTARQSAAGACSEGEKAPSQWKEGLGGMPCSNRNPRRGNSFQGTAQLASWLSLATFVLSVATCLPHRANCLLLHVVASYVPHGILLRQCLHFCGARNWITGTLQLAAVASNEAI